MKDSPTPIDDVVAEHRRLSEAFDRELNECEKEQARGLSGHDAYCRATDLSVQLTESAVAIKMRIEQALGGL